VRQEHLIQTGDEHLVKLQAFCGMQRQHGGRVNAFRQGVLIRNQRHGLQKGLQALFFILKHHGAQFHHVFPAVQPFFALVLDVRLVADVLKDAVKQNRDPILLRAIAPAPKHAPETCQAGGFPAKRFLPSGVALRQTQQELTRAQVLLGGKRC